MNKTKPNVVCVFGDQWRQQALGCAGDPNVKTPHLDALARESIHYTHAVAGCPVCSPSRASLLTGQRPLTHGVFVNDVPLEPKGTPIGTAFANGGYDTAYIGKWHVNAHGRTQYIPPERRLGFDYWKVLECTHDYNHSPYYAQDSEEKRYWDGYDAVAQTADAEAYIRDHAEDDSPFFLMLSWGPPHAPYDTAPAEYQALYDPETLELRPNVPEEAAAETREWLAGYYAHCTALDDCMGRLLDTLDSCGIADDTLVLFLSDHGDMLGSHGRTKKQQPWDESIRIPFLLRYPNLPGWQPRETDALINIPDVMPTLLGLCGLPIPDSVEGVDFSGHIRGGDNPDGGGAVLTCPHPFGQWSSTHHDGREYRGIRTRRYSYVRDLSGPWLLYDNEVDPFQMRNQVDNPEFASLRDELDALLQRKLDEENDRFLPGLDYISQWGYVLDPENLTVPYEE
jgi:arylsulfatase A-like enzyme